MSSIPYLSRDLQYEILQNTENPWAFSGIHSTWYHWCTQICEARQQAKGHNAEQVSGALDMRISHVVLSIFEKFGIDLAQLQDRNNLHILINGKTKLLSNPTSLYRYLLEKKLQSTIAVAKHYYPNDQEIAALKDEGSHDICAKVRQWLFGHTSELQQIQKIQAIFDRLYALVEGAQSSLWGKPLCIGKDVSHNALLYFPRELFQLLGITQVRVVGNNDRLPYLGSTPINISLVSFPSSMYSEALATAFL